MLAVQLLRMVANHQLSADSGYLINTTTCLFVCKFPLNAMLGGKLKVRVSDGKCKYSASMLKGQISLLFAPVLRLCLKGCLARIMTNR
jgi:hypothetical protein